nr:MAG TPA: hypothetical protein [Caudoviricetes sp.]
MEQKATILRSWCRLTLMTGLNGTLPLILTARW